VRASASTSGTFLGSQPTNTTGKIVDGPVSSGGYVWWNIDFDNSVLDGWTIQNNLTVTGSGTVTTTYTLTANTAGTGTGSITGNTTTYTSGATATLTAVPATGSTFTSWTGCTSTSGTTCTVSMTSNKTVTATFTKDPIIEVATQDKILSISGPKVVAIGKTYSITVTYDAKVDRDMHLELKNYGTYITGMTVFAPA